jgi:hypothetical protein
MKEGQEYIKDIAEMRSMMERSSKFLSISALACLVVGLYALAGSFIAYKVLGFDTNSLKDGSIETGSVPEGFINILLLAIVILILAVGTAFLLSYRKAAKMGEKAWNPTATRLLINMSVPLVVGGVLTLILIFKGFIGLAAPFTLLFYGLALYNGSKYTFDELRSLGLIQIALGLAGSYYVEYGLLLWTIGFGLVHVVYGIYLHYRYER